MSACNNIITVKKEVGNHGRLNFYPPNQMVGVLATI